MKLESRLVLGLCLLAGIRALVFAAAFPLFGNVDEQGHFDLVYKFARGHLPGKLEVWDEAAARAIVLYGSPEYFEIPASFPGGVFPGLRAPDSVNDRLAYEAEVARLAGSINHESTQPPLYYAVAGGWLDLARLLGVRGAHLLYAVRFLNPLLYGLVTWLAYRAARAVFADNRFVRLGVPALVAVFPQDVFFTVNNDVLLPLAGAAAFLALVAVLGDTGEGYTLPAVAGLLVAACVLVKLSAVAVLPVAAGVAGWVVFTRPGPARRAAIVKAGVLLGAAAAPLVLWGARNLWISGDLTGSAEKARLLGWSWKPLSAMFDHPLFTPGGLAYFWRETMASFFRGELVWGLKPLASPVADTLYALSTLVCLAAAVIASRRKPAAWIAFALFGLSIVFLAVLSVAFDFGDCFYPSRESPFMVSGRLALGALVPFALLYVRGLDALVPQRAGQGLRWALLIAAIAFMAITELRLSSVAFASAYNWFHL